MGREYDGGDPAPKSPRYKSLAVYGPPKTLKTRMALSLPGRKFCIDWDHGMWAAAEDLLKPDDVVFEPDDWPDTIDRLMKLADEFAIGKEPPYDVIVGDSATEGYDMCMRDVLHLPRKWGAKESGPVPIHPAGQEDIVVGGRRQVKSREPEHEDETFTEKGRVRRAMPEQRDYGLAHERWKVFVRNCRKFNALFVLIAHEGVNQDDTTKVISGGMLLPGKMMQQIPGQFDFYLRAKEIGGEFKLVTQHEGFFPAGYRKGHFEKYEDADLTKFLRKAGIEI